MTQSVNKQIGTITAVEAEAHFVQIGLQMLRTEAVPRSDDAALEQRERRFNRVRVNVGSEAHVLFRGVINGFVFGYCQRPCDTGGIRR